MFLIYCNILCSPSPGTDESDNITDIFELNENSSIRKLMPPFFGKIVFADFGGGYEDLKGILRTIQRNNLPSFKEVTKLVRNLPWLLKAVWWRVFEKRVLFPKNPSLEFYIIIEQIPDIGTCNCPECISGIHYYLNKLRENIKSNAAIYHRHGVCSSVIFKG